METFAERQEQLMLDLVEHMASESQAVMEPALLHTEVHDNAPSNSTLRLSSRRLQVLGQARDHIIKIIGRFVENQKSQLALQHKQLVPFDRLPNELHTIIFELVQTSTIASIEEGEDNDTGNVLHIGWCLSRVSRLWRQIALRTPRLWTLISMPAPEFVDACLSRSQDLPVDIMLKAELRGDIYRDPVTQYEAEVQKSTPLLLTHAARWRALVVADIRPKYYAPLFAGAAPRMEKLDLKIANKDDHYEWYILPKAFCGTLSGLRELRLKDMSIPLSSGIYKNLVKLSLKFVTFAEDTVGNFLEVLPASPHLEILSLWAVYFNSTANEHFPESPIHLPHLKEIWLDQMELVWPDIILNSIHISSSTQIFVSGYLGAFQDLADIIPPPDVLPNTIPGLLEITDLIFNFESKPEHCLLGCSARTPELRGNLLNLDFGSLPSREGRDAVAKSVFLGLGQELPLAEIISVVLVHVASNFIQASDFIQVLSRLPHLAELTLHYCAAPFMNTIGQGELALPNLTSLSFHDLVESKMNSPHMRMPTPKEFAAMLSNLPTVQTLSFINCSARLIRVLTSTPTKHLCEHMSELHLEKCDITAKDLVPLAKSRIKWGTVADLETLWVCECKAIDKAVTDELKKIIDYVGSV
ncbi:hypothetical protein BOTBODRAFT_68383 [Botryobasidium botryosum FD-172 SS1]|uniref:F-box domain-containing protein n=1 Tax=Botryobasidium botryosum (strain FD-172 SS1) TaxID=930990 RepID=A0A067M5F7_BOTB1|nr:hypothetical protein BOTBODRAFT_68383 [Botryobasidium botryosum FD-172 SS1]